MQTVVRKVFPILPYDETAATWHGQERERLERIGRTPTHVDGQIAAIAHCNDLTLVTTNSKHFKAFKDLTLADWTG